MIHSNVDCRFSETAEFTIYRTIIELINNSIKHAKADKINIDVNYSNGILHVSFSDDGQGFDYEKIKAKGKGFGLMNLENRIRQIGGHYQYFSAPTQGTKVDITIQSNCL